MLSNQSKFVDLRVGGIPFQLEKVVADKYPKSKFHDIIVFTTTTCPVIIDRNGSTFELVNEFLKYEYLPRNREGKSELSVWTLKELREEANFFNLPELANDCDVIEFQERINLQPLYTNLWTYEYWSKDPNAFVNTVRSVWAPFCV